MNNKLLLLFGLAALAQAQTIWLGTPGTGFCTVTNATNATPIRITVSDISLCGITANGQSVIVTEIGGNTKANIHLVNSGDSAVGLRRIVAGLSGNSFDLQDGAGASLVGNGTYTNGGRVSLATSATLKAGPIGYLDGTGGPILASLSDTTSTGRAFATRPAMLSLVNRATAWTSAWGDDRSGAHALALALHWKATGNTTSRDKALALLAAVDQLLPTTACVEGTNSQCGSPAQSHADYPSQYMVHWSNAFSIMRADMTAPDVTHFVNWALNDLPWSQGGVDYTASAHTKTAWKAFRTPGTVSVSGTAVTGTGTTFVTSGAVAGDIILAGVNVDAEGYQIASVNSETSITLVQSAPTLGAGSQYQIGPAWVAGQMGLIWHAKHYDNAVLCGGAVQATDRSDGLSYIRTCEYYPTIGFSNEAVTAPGGRSGYNSTGHQNLAIARVEGMSMLGIVTCQVDPRGCLLAQQAHEWMKNVIVMRGLNIWTGFTQSTSGYQSGRMINVPISADAAFRNSTVQGISMLTGTNVVKNLMRWGYSAPVKALGKFVPGVESLDYDINVDRYRGPQTAEFHSPTLPEAGYLRYHIFTELGISDANANSSYDIRYNNGEYVWQYFLWDTPTVAQVAPPTTENFTLSDRAACVSRYGAARCPTDEYAHAAVSRQDLTATGTYVHANIAAQKCLDHCQTPYNSPGWSFMQKNGRVLRGGDHASFYATRERRDYVEFGGLESTRKTYPEGGTSSIYWAAGNNTYSVVNADLSAAWKASANVTTDAEQTIHLKSGAQDFILHHVRAVASVATQIRQRQLFPLNGCGTVTSTSCVSFSSSTNTITTTFTSPNARLLQKILPLGGLAIKTKTETGTDTNGSYTGGAGLAFAIEVCPSTDAGATCDTSETTAEWVTVMQPTTNTSDTLPTIVSGTSGSFRTIEIQHATAPAVAIFTAAGVTGTSATLTTTHSGTAQYVVSGLATGGYTVTRNAVLVGTYYAQATQQTITFSAASGTIAIAAAVATAWYVSPSGSGSTCSLASPCSLITMLESPPAVQPGDTVYLRAGTHVIGRYLFGETPWRQTSIAGAETLPITFRPYPGESPSIDGGIYFLAASHDIVVRDLIIDCKSTTRVSAQSGPFPTDIRLPSGLVAYGPRIKFINNVLIGGGEGIELWDTGPDSLAYGNLILYQGWQGTDRGHGHGFYVQNATGQTRLEENITHNPFAEGIQVYGTSASNLNNVYLQGNVFFNSGDMNNVSQRNMLVGGTTLATNMIVRSNYNWTYTAKPGGDGSETNFGYWNSGSGCSNMEVSTNYFVSGNISTSIADGTGGMGLCQFNSLTGGNTLYGTTRGLTLPGYASANRTITSGTKPGTAEVFVRPNSFETGRANIIVFNWPRASTVSVSLAGIGLNNGDTFTIKDSQNFFGTPVVSGTYTGANVTIDMTTTTMTAAPTNAPFSPLHSDREFGAFIVQLGAAAPATVNTINLRGLQQYRGLVKLR